MIMCGNCVLFGRGCPKNVGPYNWLTVGVVSPCESYSGPCPLPRVGSKDWDWRKDGNSLYDLELHIDGKLAYGLISYDELERAQIIRAGETQHTIADAYLNLLGVNILKDRRRAAIRFAKDMCELHARREWSRKNKARKG